MLELYDFENNGIPAILIYYGGHYGYHFLIFNDDGITQELISEPHEDWETWWAEWLAHHEYPYFQQNPTIFGMPEVQLTPLHNLSVLESHIIESFQRRHGLITD